MRIDIWSDVVCPWCYLGEHRFQLARARMQHGDQLDVRLRAFQLDPRAPREPQDLRRVVEAKYGPGAHDRMTERLTALGAAEGLDYRFDRVQRVNTFDAHRLLTWAGTVGSREQLALAHRLFGAYFTDGADVGDPEVLEVAATTAGLDGEEARGVVATDAFADVVHTDRAEASELGITGVPAFVLEGRWVIPGAQDVDTLVRIFERALERLAG